MLAPPLLSSLLPPRPHPPLLYPSPCPTKAISAQAGTRPYGHGWQHGDRGKSGTLSGASLALDFDEQPEQLNDRSSR